jgi:3,4-dihydroxy-9,10-secoandrosta-1,3,5(10)-triene-9,17-dione 4,5-dioxygenase
MRQGEGTKTMKIRGLGYIGVAATDPVACLRYATDILGLMPARAVAGEAWGTPAVPGSGPASGGSGIAADGTVYLKLDDWQWRIAVHPDTGRTGLLYMGFELDSELALEQAVAELSAAGYPAKIGERAQAEARAVAGIAYTSDPAGNAIELFWGPTLDRKFQSPKGMRFDTGDMGLGHVGLLVDRLKDCKDFYVRVLGFRLTDYIEFGPDMSANFYHTNPRHHTIGLMRVGPFNATHHLMLQASDIDQVGQCLERAEAAGTVITSTLGRHANDRMLSFYMRSPLGFEVEIGCEAIRVGDDWTPRAFVEGDIWGHKGLTAEAIQSSAQQTSN